MPNMPALLQHPDAARSLLAILIFGTWTLALVSAIALLRWHAVSRLGFRINKFRVSGEDVSPFSERLCRAHANCYENIGLFTAIVGVAVATGQAHITGPLALWCVAARLAQSTTHLCSTRSRWVLVRFSFMVVQVVIVWTWAVRLLAAWL